MLDLSLCLWEYHINIKPVCVNEVWGKRNRTHAGMGLKADLPQVKSTSHMAANYAYNVRMCKPALHRHAHAECMIYIVMQNSQMCQSMMFDFTFNGMQTFG